ncbi:MAG: hypothetical protein AABW56_00180, partial [Nanoarchaeota archaeon]
MVKIFKFKKSRLRKLSLIFVAIILFLFITSSVNLFAQEGQSQQKISGGTITISQFTKPNVIDLNVYDRLDIKNITWNSNNSYATLRLGIYYAGTNRIYSLGDASSSLKTNLIEKILSYSGTSMEWGGTLNLSLVPSIIKSKGFQPVWEVIKYSEDIRIEGKRLWIDDDVYINFVDKNSSLNIFNITNSTHIFLTNNNALFYDTIIYDPTINTTTGNVGIFNNTIYNDTTKGIHLNHSLGNGSYIFPVENLSSDGTLKQITNITYSNSTPAG